jgi:hypothetical protein
VTLELAVFLAVVVVAVMRAPGAAPWSGGEGIAAAAAMQPGDGRGAAAVALDALASVFPMGELAFRLALLGAVALAFAAAGIVALARALVPTAAGAGAIAAALFAISPAATSAASGQGAIAAALVVWPLVAAVRSRRAHGDVEPPYAAAVAVGVLAAMAPFVAIVLASLLGFVRRPSTRPAASLGMIGVAAAALLLTTVPVLARGDAPSLWHLLGGGDAAGARLLQQLAPANQAVRFVWAVVVALVDVVRSQNRNLFRPRHFTPPRSSPQLQAARGAVASE